MIKRDLYCFKSGKLELSILDEDLEEEIKETLVHSEIESQMTYIPLDQEELCTSSQEDDQEVNFTSYLQPQLIVTEEISHTLKTMSEFLMQTEVSETQSVCDVSEEAHEEEFVEELIEELVEELIEELGEAFVEELIEEFGEDLAGHIIGDSAENERIDASKESREIETFDINNREQIVREIKFHQNETSDACLSSSTGQVVNMQNMQHHIKSNTALQQRVIDDILLSHFGEITTKFPYEKELKQRIENQIYKIKSYK